MATLQDAVDAELKCPICHDLLKSPRVLPCLHSFCEACLDQVVARVQPKGNVICPYCNAPHPRPDNGAKGFKSNFTLCNILEARDLYDAELETQRLKCENGLDSDPGVARCIDCECYLCVSCRDQHLKLKATRTHRIISLADIKNDVRKLEYKRFCVDHEDEELRLYCKDCEEVICRDCTIVTHKPHNYDFIKNVRPELEEKMRGLLREVERKSIEFDDHLKYLDKVEGDSNDNFHQSERQVRFYFEEYREKLLAQEEHLLQTLKEAQGERSKQLGHHKEILETSKAKLESAKLFADQLLGKGIPVDIAMMSKQTCKRLEDLQAENWDPNSIQPSQWAFMPDENDDPFKAKICGGISRGDIIVENLGQPIRGPNEFIVRLNSDIDSTHSNLVVSVTDNDGKRIQNIETRKEDKYSWKVTYNITTDGIYIFSVSVDGIDAAKSPFVREWAAKLSRNMRVRRGNDWKWGDQDGGPEACGTVMGWAEEVGASNNWVKIKWDKTNRQNNYRWGAEGSYDLQIVVPLE